MKTSLMTWTSLKCSSECTPARKAPKNNSAPFLSLLQEFALCKTRCFGYVTKIGSGISPISLTFKLITHCKQTRSLTLLHIYACIRRCSFGWGLAISYFVHQKDLMVHAGWAGIYAASTSTPTELNMWTHPCDDNLWHWKAYTVLQNSVWGLFTALP